MGDVVYRSAAESDVNSSTGGFMDWLGGVGDTVLDVAGTAGKLWAENEFSEDPVEKQPAAAGSATAGAEVVTAGVPTGGSFDLFGVSLNRTAVYVAGGALLGIVVLRLLK